MQTKTAKKKKSIHWAGGGITVATCDITRGLKTVCYRISLTKSLWEALSTRMAGTTVHLFHPPLMSSYNTTEQDQQRWCQEIKQPSI